jgi:hypothetical protein
VAEGISNVLKKGFNVIINEEIAHAYSQNRELRNLLAEFVSGRPKWLQK